MNLTIRAEDISRHLPMHAICLDKTTYFKGQKIRFFKVIDRYNEWVLLGKTLDGASFFSTADKEETFGVIEDEINN